MSHPSSNPCPVWEPLFMFLVFCLINPAMKNPTTLPAAKEELLQCSPLGFTKPGSRCKIRGFLGSGDIGVTAGTKVATENKQVTNTGGKIFLCLFQFCAEEMTLQACLLRGRVLNHACENRLIDFSPKCVERGKGRTWASQCHFVIIPFFYE